MSMIDKENIHAGVNTRMHKSPLGKRAAPKSRSGGGFGRLLAEVTNEMKVETDHMAARKIHKDEATEIACEWVREACDAREAKKLHAELEKEDKEASAEAIKLGEKEALRVAMDERRSAQQKAEAKKIRERADAEMAKQSVLDDIDETIKFSELCAKDDGVAQKVHMELQDELLAEELAMKESEEYAEYRKQFEAQCKMNEEAARRLDAELRRKEEKEAQMRIEDDAAVAYSTFLKLEREETEERASQEKADLRMAKVMEVKAQREAHRNKKAADIEKSGRAYRTAGDVRRQWANAEASIEDVSRGICISIQLPFMRDLRVRVGKQQNVEIEARRLLAHDEPIEEADEDGSCYIAEFFIDGAKSKITDECVSYEYSSVSGLLHVYVDNVHLERMEKKERDSMVSKFKKSFGRIFGRSRKAESK